MKPFILLLTIFVNFLPAQDSTANLQQNDSLKTGLTSFNKKALSISADTLGLKLTYPTEEKREFNMQHITLPANPLEIDMRTSSYYTPRNVQDKMDKIMNRPRSDSFVPVLAMAAFAVNIALKQMEAAKLFEPRALDYLVDEKQISILEALWKKAPQKIDALYRNDSLNTRITANGLQNALEMLAENNLVKTREESNKVILFFPGQKKATVLKMVKERLNHPEDDPETQREVKNLYLRLSGKSEIDYAD